MHSPFSKQMFSYTIVVLHYRLYADPGGWVQSPLPGNLQAIGLLINIKNIGPDPLENHKATRPAFNVVPSSLARF